MSKDRRRAVLAGLFALSVMTGAGSAGAQNAFTTARVGAGIDYTQRVHPGAVQHGIGAATALERLSRPVKQDKAIEYLPRGSSPIPVGGLRGLLTPSAINSDGLLAGSAVFDGQPPGPRASNRPMPYFRFGEGEQVYGLSFKIQPPPQVPEPTARGS